jgi:hypothetical protein
MAGDGRADAPPRRRQGLRGKTGNIYAYLGDSDEERAKNLKLIKDWLGEDAWFTNRWMKRGEVPSVTKEQLEKVRAKY